MENHGITMKGKYFMEEVSNPSSTPGTDDRRLIYNTSANVAGSPDAFGGFKMYYHNDSQWLRPLVGNADDGPNTDNTVSLGNATYRFQSIYSADFYGQVRYS